MNVVYLSLGTNLGNREEHLRKAIHLLEQEKEIQVQAVSSVYETEPVGVTDQPAFLNVVIKAGTSFTSFELLDICMQIEKELGRKRLVRWGPRTIDLDILLYNQDNIESESLVVPHPRMAERAFVLIPLAEINTKIVIPGTEVPVEQHINSIQGKEGVKLWKTADAFYRL